MKNSKVLKVLFIILIMIAIAVVSFGTTFAILKRYQMVGKPYLFVNGESVSRLEYNYYFNSVYRSYVKDMESILSYMNVDMDRDLFDQMHDDEKTFGEYFDECTQELIKKNYALWEDGHQKGFSYDSKEDYKEYLKKVKETIGSMSLNEYFETTYGPGANTKTLKRIFERDFYCTAYYNYLNSGMDKMKTNVDEAYFYSADLVENYEITFP